MEAPPPAQAIIDAFVRGDDIDESALLSDAHWRLRDGRASEAILRVLQQARASSSGGGGGGGGGGSIPLRVFGFDVSVPAPRASERHGRAMAARVLEEAGSARAEEGVLVLLAGSTHCDLALPTSLASLVRRQHPARVRSLRALHRGGSTYSYVSGRSGVHRIGSPTSTATVGSGHGTGQPAILDLEEGALHVGVLTPSPPARAAAAPKSCAVS